MVGAAPLERAFFERPAVEVAPELIGCVLTRNGVGGPIVEVEAYDQHDEASHSFAGRTDRNAAMFGPPGHIYVYRSYGIHWCMNLVCDREGHGAGVLLRAIEPALGVDEMRRRRPGRPDRELAAGPGRLTSALGVTDDHDGTALGDEIVVHRGDREHTVISGPRVGISRAVDRPWRYASAESRYLSVPIQPKVT